MTVSLAPSTCPRCGLVEAVFIRSELHKDLVCRSCLQGAPGRRDSAPSAESTSREPAGNPSQLRPPAGTRPWGIR